MTVALIKHPNICTRAVVLSNLAALIVLNHPSSSTYLRSHGIGLVGYSSCPFPQQCFPALPVGSQVIPRPDEMDNASSEFWVCPKVSFPLVVLRNPPEAGTQEAS